VTPGALALPVIGERFGLERDEGGVAVFGLADHVKVGRFALTSAPGVLTIDSLCIDEAFRSYGAGSEAVLMFNRACDAAGIPHVRAWAPPDRGLAVYFWIRMGFRPVHGEGPQGGLWFERRTGSPPP
jgi:hypothetical protein